MAKIKRLCAVFLALLMLTPVFAASASPFLTHPGEKITRDELAGSWSYRTQHLATFITRKTDDTPRVWYEAEIFASPEEPLYTLISSGKKPGHRLVNPLNLARENHVVLGISDDFCGYRLRRDLKAGIVIRQGEVISEKTFSRNKWRTWPNLDTLAVYADGSMKTYPCDELTAEEYLAQGAVNVFAFGPVLVSQGQINETVLDESYYPYPEPRMAIGMIEPWHYMIVAVEGRKDASVGAKPDWLARKMHELGCVEALNLDGGGTAVLIFMGEVLNRSGKSLRSINSILCFGQSMQVGTE